MAALPLLVLLLYVECTIMLLLLQHVNVRTTNWLLAYIVGCQLFAVFESVL